MLGKISFAEMLVASIVQKAGATSARVAPAPAIGLMTAARSQNCTRRRDAISATSCSLSIPAWAKAVGIGEMTVTRQHGNNLQFEFSGSCVSGWRRDDDSSCKRRKVDDASSLVAESPCACMVLHRHTQARARRKRAPSAVGVDIGQPQRRCHPEQHLDVW